MKPLDSKKLVKKETAPEVRDQVIELGRTNSFSEVSRLTGLPVGTVKTIISRSGSRRDNEALRRLTSLPEPRDGVSRELVAPDVPEVKGVTGNFELDAVIQLREFIKTGDPALIAQSLEARKRIKTPLKELEKAYGDWLLRESGNAFAAALGGLGFADLDGLAERSLEKARRKADALARFGSVDDLFAATPAEQFCIDALHGLGVEAGKIWIDAVKSGARFRANPELLPHTLSDCLWELGYWSDLYRLRSSFDGHGDPIDEVAARENFLFAEMGHIRPRSRDEAVAVLRYLAENGAMDRTGADAILHNLVR